MWKAPVLYSYAYQKKITTEKLKEHEDSFEILIDSGAYTAFSCGKPVDLDAYCSWLQGLPFKEFSYIQLDAIGDVEQTKKNLVYMVEQGLKPIPVFTRGMTGEDMDFLYSFSDHIALGGIATTTGRREHCKWAMDTLVQDSSIHWLGFSDNDFIRFYRPNSVDNRNWMSAERFGKLLLPINGRMQTYTREQIMKLPPAAVNMLHKLGYNQFEFRGKDAWRRVKDLSKIGQVAIDASFYLGYLMERRLGTKTYQVMSSYYGHLLDFIASIERLKTNNLVKD